MAANEIHVGDIGTVITVTLKDDTTAVDISGATTKTIYLSKPDGTVLAKGATFTSDGTNGKMYYATLAGDLDQPGHWQIQAKVVLATGTWYSDVSTFDVEDNL
jgi:hypothetical protein